MMAPLTLRKAETEDIAAVVALVNSAYRGDASRAGWTTEADLLDGQRTDPVTLREQIAEPNAALLLHHASRELAACVYLARRGREAYLGMLTVRPGGQAAGLGSALLAGAEDYAVTIWQARAMCMTVIAQRRELIAWYERRGYVDTGEREPFPYGDARFGLPKRSDLEFLVLRKALSANA
jgi:ribosomal protein S18 acetylase RimI-like enzyme